MSGCVTIELTYKQKGENITMICMQKITNENRHEKYFVSFVHTICFTTAVYGISVSKNSQINQIQ